MKKTSQSADEKSVGIKLPGYWTFFRNTTTRSSVRDIRESLANGSTKTPVEVVTNGSINPDVKAKPEAPQEPQSETTSTICDNSSTKLENVEVTNSDEKNNQENSDVVVTKLEKPQSIPNDSSHSKVLLEVESGLKDKETSIDSRPSNSESIADKIPEDLRGTGDEAIRRKDSIIVEKGKDDKGNIVNREEKEVNYTLIGSEQSESAQKRLEKSQSLIEILQQNLATQVSSETKETYKDSIAKNQVASQGVKHQSELSTKPALQQNLATQVSSERKEAYKDSIAKNQVASQSVKQQSELSRKPALQQNLSTQVSSETKETYKDSIAKNQVASQGVKQQSEPPTKPVRVSWTTRLIQKLTEEEAKKKTKQETKVQKPKRIVRFPQKKAPKTEKKEWPKFYPGIKKPEVETERKENVSGIQLDSKEKDAYACLITQLADPEAEQEEKKKRKSIEEKDETRLQKVEEIRAALAREECATSSDEDSVVDMKEKPTGIRRLLPQNLFSRKEEYERPVLEPLLKRGDRVYPARPVHETAFLSRSHNSSPARDNEHNSSRSKSMSPSRDRRTVPDASQNAYYHSPPSRRKMSEGSSASSSSTLVADNNWNPLLVNLEHQAISGSPDIRRLQQQKHYGEIRRNDNQGLVQVQVPSGRLSAPPYHGDDYPKRKMTTPEPPRSSRRSSSQPPRQRNSLQAVTPMSAQVKITTSSHDANCKETQTNKSYIQQQCGRQCQGKHPPSQPPHNKPMSPGQYQNSRQYRSLSPIQQINKHQHSPSVNRPGQPKQSPSQPEIYPNSTAKIQRSHSPAAPVNKQYQKNASRQSADDLNRQYQNIPAQFQRSLSPTDSLNRHQLSHLGSQQLQHQSKPNAQYLDRSMSPTRYRSSPAQLHRSLSPAESLNRQQHIGRLGSQQLQQQNKQSPQQLNRSLSPVRYQNSPIQLERSLSPAESLDRQRQHSNSGTKQLQHQNKHSPQQLDRSLSPVRYQNSPSHFQRSLSPAESLNRQHQNNQAPFNQGTLNRQHQDSPVQISPQLLHRQYQNSPVQFSPQTLNRQYQNSATQLSPHIPNRQYMSSPSLQSNLSPAEAFNRQYHVSPEQQISESLNRQYQKIPAQHSTDSLNRQYQNSPVEAGNRQHQSRQQYKKLSRQEVEALYWETQRLRAGLSSLSQQLNISTSSLQTPPPVPRPAYRAYSTQNVGSGYGSLLVKPQPVTPRARSVSPSPDRHLNTRSLSLPRDTNFSRGTPMRNTIGPIRTQPPIYEETEEVQLRHGNKGGKKKSNYAPIFKRGSLTCPVDDSGSSPSPKRVSFTSSGEQLYWPTRNGPAPEPPTRQRKSTTDSDDYNTYANIPATMTAPNRPLPPVPRERAVVVTSSAQRWQQQSESESGSEAGEVQRILQQGSQGRGSYFRFPEEEWGADGKARGTSGTEQSASNVGRDDEVRRSGGGGGRSGRRDEPRRHTLSGDHHHHQQGGALARSMDLESPLPRGYPPPSTAMLFDDDPGIMSEVETSSTGFRRGGKQRSSLPVVRTPSKTLERPLGKTSGAGVPIGVGPMLRISQQMVPPHHHGLSNKQSASSGGLVFLQYRNETKRALLPNEITSIDTVKALFVRSFPKQLTMEYLDSPHVKIYIHDSSKDMFYELEDLRSHLRDIRDRSVLRLFESTDMNGGVLPGAGVGVVAPPMWDQDQSYFSEPEFDSEYQHQHIHKTKASSKSGSSGGVPPQAPYYMTHSYPPGGGSGAPGASATLPRGGPLLRAYSPAVAPPVPADRIKTLPQSDRLHAESGYMSSPERGGPRAYPAAAYPPGGPGYEDPYYSQYASRSGSITPVIDEEARIRVEHMERQLANLTGLVQKALTQTPTPREYLQVPPPASARDANYRNDDTYLRTDTKPPKLGKDKSVSFEKSVSFSDEPPDMNSPKQHSPQHAERTERDRHKPAPPPKPVSLSPGQYEGRHVYRDLQLTPEMYNQLRGLQKKAKDLRQEVRNLRRMSQAQAHSVRETIRDTFMKIRAMLLMGGEESWAVAGDADKVRLNREEDSYKQEMLRLEKDLTELESTVEELRGNVINRKTRVNMSDVENMALILSKSSKTVADLKVRFPGLQEGMKGLLASEMEKVVREEKFLKEEPERLESALRRCKKLTGTLVTLKRLASVQEQRLPPSATPDSRLSPTMGLGGDSDTPITPPAHGKPGAIPARGVMAPSIGSDGTISRQRPENALDALLDELQTFARPPSRGHNPPMADIGRKGSIDSAHTLPSSTGTSSLRRLHSYPSSSDGGGNSPPTLALSRLQVSGSTADAPKSPATSPKPPVPERNSELLSQLAGRRVPPPPPPRTSSRSPLASPTSPSLPPRGQPQMGIGSGTLLRRGGPGRSSLREPLRTPPATKQEESAQPQPSFNPASNSSSCESINSQEGLQNKTTTTSAGNKARQEILEQRHQELLRKQRALQEQYARLQQLQRGGGGSLAVVPPPDLLLKKTGSESNLLAKMGLGHGLTAAAPISGSLTHLAAVANQQPIVSPKQVAPNTTASATTTTTVTSTTTTTTTNKIYETDIL